MSLFRLKINGQFVVMQPKSKIKLVVNTGIFKFSKDKPTRTYTFKIPAAENTHVFGVVNNMFTRDVNTEFEMCEGYLGSRLLGKCKTFITDWNDATLSIQVVFNEGAFAPLMNRSLRSFEYKNPYPFRYDVASCYSSNYSVNAPLVNGSYTITLTIAPIGNRYNTVTKQFTLVYTGVYAELEACGQQIVDYFNSTASDTGYVAEPDPMGPQLFTVYAVGALRAPSLDITFTSSDPGNFGISKTADNSVNQTTALHSFYNATLDGSKEYVYAPVYTPNIFNDTIIAANPSNASKYQLLNAYIPKVPGQPSFPGTPAGLIFAPFANLKYVLYKVHAEYGLSVDFDDLFDTENNKLFIFNDEVQNILFKRFTKFWENKSTHAFQFNSIVPDITVQDLVDGIRFMFNTLVSYNGATNSITIKKIDSIVKGKAIDLTDKFIPGYAYNFKPNTISISYAWPSDRLVNEFTPQISDFDLAPAVNFVTDLPATPRTNDTKEVRFVKKENKYYAWNTSSLAWEVFADGLYPLTIEKASKTIQIGATPLVCVPYPFKLNSAGLTTMWDAKQLVCITAQTGNNADSDRNTPSLRLMYYRGMQACSAKLTSSGAWFPAEYPMLSNHNYDVDGIKIGNKSLSINAEDGLYNTYYKRFFERCANNSPMKLRFKLTEADILSNQLLKIMVENHEYLVDEFEIEIGEEIETTIATVHPIISR